MRIKDVSIVRRDDAPEWVRPVFCAELENGEQEILFEQIEEVRINPEQLKGMLVSEARQMRTRRIINYAIS